MNNHTGLEGGEEGRIGGRDGCACAGEGGGAWCEGWMRRVWGEGEAGWGRDETLVGWGDRGGLGGDRGGLNRKSCVWGSVSGVFCVRKRECGEVVGAWCSCVLHTKWAWHVCGRVCQIS